MVECELLSTPFLHFLSYKRMVVIQSDEGYLDDA